MKTNDKPQNTITTTQMADGAYVALAYVYVYDNFISRHCHFFFKMVLVILHNKRREREGTTNPPKSQITKAPLEIVR